MEIATREGWREFVELKIEKPAEIPFAVLGRLTPEDRQIYNWARARYSQAGAFVKTPQFVEFQRAARDRVYLNAHRQVGKLGLILSGEPGQGKTTTLLQIGKEHELRRRQTAQPTAAEGWTPVVYVAVPAQCSAKALLLEFARFLGLPTLSRATYGTLLDTVANALRRCRTELVLIDDVHHLDLRFRQNIEASDMLKQLSERCGGTFVYAGIAVEETGLLDGTREGQIRKRFELHPASPFRITTKRGQADWGDLLLAIEDSLGLLQQPAGQILASAKTLHALTAGEIGPLKDLLQLAALHSMQDGSETLKAALFERGLKRRQAERDS